MIILKLSTQALRDGPFTILHKVAKCWDSRKLVYLLVSRGAEVNRTDHRSFGWTPLHFAGFLYLSHF